MTVTDPLPAEDAAHPDRALAALRARIDALDAQIAALLQERARVSLEVGRVKGSGSSRPILVPEREREVVANVQAVAGPLSPRALAAIYREVLSASRTLQAPMRVAHLGPAATYGYQAAREYFGASAELVPCTTNVDVFHAIERGEADFGLVPFENSTEGPVMEVLDRLAAADMRLTVCGEVTIPIAHALVSRAASLADVRCVRSHPQAAGQVRGWLAAHLPNVPVEPANSTGAAAQQAQDDPTIAAVAPRVAAEVFGLNVLAENIQDLGGNVTRFLVLSRSSTTRPTGADRTALVFSVRDRVGALRDLTDAFATSGVNLSSIQSRPSRRKAWDYLFFVELAGHAAEPRVQDALARAEQHTVFLKVIGSWPVGDDPLA